MAINYPDTKNPFFSDEDDNIGFGSSSKSGRPQQSSRSRFDYDGDVPDDEFAKPVLTKAEMLQQMKQESVNRQLESTQRALSSIYDSERMGVATAEELLHQGEQLDNIERKTESINQDMKTSQRHLNSIKSVFGGIKNWWGGKKNDEPAASSSTPEPKQSRLRNAVDSHQDSEPHPAMRIRSDDFRGFYDTDGQGELQQTSSKPSGAMAQYDKQFNQNLDMMAGGMSRLKNLALGLGDEIETQNEQVDRINEKVGRANVTIEDQNKQMRGILGTKSKK